MSGRWALAGGEHCEMHTDPHRMVGYLLAVGVQNYLIEGMVARCIRGRVMKVRV